MIMIVLRSYSWLLDKLEVPSSRFSLGITY